MKIKRIPALTMLLAGAVAAVVTYINGYSLEDMLVVLIVTLIVFLIIGVVIMMIFESFHIDEPDEDRVDDDGEVVEKTEPPAEGEEDGEEGAEGENASAGEEGANDEANA